MGNVSLDPRITENQTFMQLKYSLDSKSQVELLLYKGKLQIRPSKTVQKRRIINSSRWNISLSSQINRTQRVSYLVEHRDQICLCQCNFHNSCGVQIGADKYSWMRSELHFKMYAPFKDRNRAATLADERASRYRQRWHTRCILHKIF